MRFLNTSEKKLPPLAQETPTEMKSEKPEEFTDPLKVFYDHIDRFYPHKSKTKIPNPIVLPGDWEFDKASNTQKIKAVGQIIDDQAYQKLSSENLKEVQEEQDDFLVNLMLQRKKSSPTFRNTSKFPLTFKWKNSYVKNSQPSRDGATGIKINNKVYVFGGQGITKDNQVKVLHPYTRKWETLATSYSPKVRYGHSAVAYKQKIIIYGGWSSYSAKLGMRRCISKLLTLNLKTLNWQRHIALGKMPSGRRHHSAAALGKHMLVFGGVDKHSEVKGSLYVLDLKAKVWEKPFVRGKFPCRRSHHTLTPVFPSNVLENPKVDLAHLPKLNSGRVACGFYLFGGLDQEGKALNDLWTLKADKGLYWAKVDLQGSLQPRYSHTSTFVNKYLFVFGGRNDQLFKETQELVQEVGVFDLEELVWKSVRLFGESPEPRWGHIAADFQNSVLIFGGMDYHRFMSAKLYTLETNQKKVQNELEHEEGVENPRLLDKILQFQEN